jgi:hypothetical protein
MCGQFVPFRSASAGGTPPQRAADDYKSFFAVHKITAACAVDEQLRNRRFPAAM